MDKYDEYENNKIQFLQETCTNIRIQNNIWNTYKKIHYLEIIKKKDIMHFTKEELMSLIKCRKAYSDSYKNILYNFIKRYLKYCVEKEYIQEDLSLDLEFPKITKQKEKKVIEKKKVEYCNLIFFKNLFAIRDCDCLHKYLNRKYYFPLLLARYGITGTDLSYIKNLKVKDVDIENKIVNIVKDGIIIKRIPVDDYFLQEISYFLQNRKGEQSVFKYSYSTIYNRKDLFYRDLADMNIKFNKYTYTSLLLMREFELLLKIRQKRRLYCKDFESIHKFFSEKTNPYVFVRDLKSLWNELVENSLDQYKNIDNKEFADSVADKLGIDLNNIPVILL